MNAAFLLLATALSAAEPVGNNAPAAQQTDTLPRQTESITLIRKLAEAFSESGAAHNQGGAGKTADEAEYKSVCRDLDDIPGLEIALNHGKVRVSGEISNPQDWRTYRRAIAEHKEVVSDFVTFRPGPEVFEALGHQLAANGFHIAEKATPEDPGSIAISYEGGIVTITGWFLSNEDIETIKSLIELHSWLGVSDESAGVPCHLKLGVVDRLVDVGVVFAGIKREAAERFGNKLADGKVLDFRTIGMFAKAFRGFVLDEDKGAPGTGNGGYARVSSDIQGVIEVFAQNNWLHYRASGHTTIDTRGEKPSEYRKGGQMVLRTSGIGGGDAKTVEYGIMIKCKGRYLRKDELALDIELENSTVPKMVEGDDDAYDQSKIKAHHVIVCKVGQTVILAGTNEAKDDVDEPSGYAFLRKVPILNWFFAGGSTSAMDDRLLILIQPTYPTDVPQLSAAPSTETIPLIEETKDVGSDVEERTEESWRWYNAFYFWNWF